MLDAKLFNASVIENLFEPLPRAHIREQTLYHLANQTLNIPANTKRNKLD
jgi:hypothetical protein